MEWNDKIGLKKKKTKTTKIQNFYLIKPTPKMFKFYFQTDFFL